MATSKGQLHALRQENESIKAELAQMTEEHGSLQQTCQELARQLEEAEDKAQGRDTMAAATQGMAHLQLGNTSQDELLQRLEVAEKEIMYWRRECARRDEAIKRRDQEISLQGNKLRQRNGEIHQSEVSDILAQAHMNAATERESYEKAIAELRNQLKKQEDEICTYQAQVKYYMDDFGQEHKEKEQALKQVDELKSELEITKELLSQYGQKQMNNAHQRRQEAMSRIQQEYYKGNPQQLTSGSFHQPAYRSRGHGIVVCDGENERQLGEDEDIIDSLVQPETSVSQLGSQLQCPKCNRSFPTERHSAFLDHIDICCP